MATAQTYTKADVQLEDLTAEVLEAGPYNSTPAVFGYADWDTVTGVLNLWFDVALNATDKAVLDAVVAAHAGGQFLDVIQYVDVRTRAPNASDDRSEPGQGGRKFVPGYRWIHKDGDRHRTYVCTDNAASAAKWAPVVSDEDHELIDSLDHAIAENYYYEVNRTSGHVQSEIWWTDSGKTQKIREIIYTRSPVTTGLVTEVLTKQYGPSGSVVPNIGTLTESVGRTGDSITSIVAVKS